MAPKSPRQLLEQVLKRNRDRPADADSLTAEGLKVPNPTRGEFLGNLDKASKPQK